MVYTGDRVLVSNDEYSFIGNVIRISGNTGVIKWYFFTSDGKMNYLRSTHDLDFLETIKA